MKLTRKAKAHLNQLLHHAQRALDYIHSEDVAVCRRSMGTTTLDYARPDGKFLYEIEKSYGSDLCGLEMAIAGLKEFIEYHSK